MRLPTVFILLGLALAITSCNEPDSGKKQNGFLQDFDRSGTEQSITVIVYPNMRLMQEAYTKKTGDATNSPRVQGWSAWSVDKPYTCVIHVVEPKRLDDEITKTWGHELTHCVYGTFHTKE